MGNELLRDFLQFTGTMWSAKAKIYGALALPGEALCTDFFSVSRSGYYNFVKGPLQSCSSTETKGFRIPRKHYPDSAIR